MKESRIGAWASRHKALIAILLLGLALGLMHVFIVPPWQHYDEPTHFEYAWLVAHRSTLPQVGDHDQEMVRQVAASMYEHGYWRGSDYYPSLIRPDPNLLGASELRHPPLYYLLASLPLRLLPYADVVLQLFAMRLVSLVFYLISIGAAWAIMGELVPADHPLRWMVPAFLALLPGYIDLMTAANNDVAAIAIFSLFLFGAIRLVQHGLSVFDFVWTAAWTALGIWTKDTIFIMVPLFALSLAISFLRGHRRILWAVLMGASIVAAVAMLDWGDAALWYRYSLQAAPTRVLSPQDPFHGYAFQIEFDGTPRMPVLSQPLGATSDALRGKTVTLGAWVWSSAPITARTPVLRVRRTNQVVFKSFDVTTTPVFHAITATVPAGADGLFVDLSPFTTAPQAPTAVYYSGVVLADGERPVDQPPEFSDEQHDRGAWGGTPFDNWVLNSTASSAWLRVRPWVDDLGARTILGQPTLILDSLFDRTVLEWYYSPTAQHIFETFWVGIGIAHIATPPEFIPILALLTVAGAMGGLVALMRRRRSGPWELVLLLAITSIGLVLLALVRGITDSMVSTIFGANSRYVYPAIIPISLLLNLGWLEWARPLGRWRLLRRAGYLVYFAFFLSLNIYTLWDMASFYRGM